MFHLWIGVMEGLLLGYIWVHIDTHSKRETRIQILNGLLVAAALLLMVPLVHDLQDRINTIGVGVFGSIKTVLLPWSAGLGLGLWSYWIFFGQPAPPPPVEAEPPAQVIESEVGTLLKLITIAVAILIVTLIVTEDRYSWFSRLQKISFGGGGVEFSPLSQDANPGAQPNAGALLATGSGQSGYTRITYLLSQMSNWKGAIERDRDVSLELGVGLNVELVKAEIELAENVVVPLGKRLNAIHKIRHYNDIAFLVSDHHSFVGRFREQWGTSFENGSGGPADKKIAVVEAIDKIWKATCKIADEITKRNSKNPKEKKLEKCLEVENKAAEDVLDKLGTGRGTGSQMLTRELPYGTLLSSLLLFAAGEHEAAIDDLNSWADGVAPLGNDAKAVLAYRSLFNAAMMSLAFEPNFDGVDKLLEQHEKTIKVGKRLLASRYRHNGRTWRMQSRLLLAPSSLRVPQFLHDDYCARDLTYNFKRFMLAQMTLLNNTAYFLSLNHHLAEMRNQVPVTENRARQLAKLNVPCLRHDAVGRMGQTITLKNLLSMQANFLDTAAAVEALLGSRENQADKQRKRLCRGRQYTVRALKLLDTARSSDRDWRLSRASIAQRGEQIATRLSRARLECSW